MTFDGDYNKTGGANACDARPAISEPAKTYMKDGTGTSTKQCALLLIMFVILNLISSSYSWPSQFPIVYHKHSASSKAPEPLDCDEICVGVQIDMNIVLDSFSWLVWEHGMCSLTLSNLEPMPVMISHQDLAEMCRNLIFNVTFWGCWDQYVETAGHNLAVEMAAEQEQLPSYTSHTTTDEEIAQVATIVTIGALAFLLPQLLSASKRLRAATVVQRAWRRILTRRGAYRRSVARDIADSARRLCRVSIDEVLAYCVVLHYYGVISFLCWGYWGLK